MTKYLIKLTGLVLVVVAFFGLGLLLATTAAQQPTVTRKVLLKRDSPIPGYEEDLVRVEIPPGAREGRHTHPGSLMVYVQEGVLTFDYEGRPTASYKPGDFFYVEPDKIHEGSNIGKTSVKILVTFFVKKGLPMTIQVQ